MTTFYFASDIHLEFEMMPYKDFPKVEPGSILLLAGDIVVARYLRAHANDADSRAFKKNFSKFLNYCKGSGFEKIFTIAGNHEPYHGQFDETEGIMKYFISDIHGCRDGSIQFLHNEMVKLRDDLILIGTTLWTNMNKGSDQTKQYIKFRMNDFRIIYKGQRPFDPDDCMQENTFALDFINHVYKENDVPGMKFLVMSHHGPTSKSAHRYYHDLDMAGGYHSDHSEFILDRPKIVKWIHGHTHYNVDYMVGDCHVITNQRGYGPHVTGGMGDPSYPQFNLEKNFEL